MCCIPWQCTLLSQYLSPPRCINVLYSLAIHFTLTVPLSTQVYKCVVFRGNTIYSQCLSPPRCINVLYSLAIHFTLTVSLSTQVYKCVVFLGRHFTLTVPLSTQVYKCVVSLGNTLYSHSAPLHPGI